LALLVSSDSIVPACAGARAVPGAPARLMSVIVTINFSS